MRGAVAAHSLVQHDLHTHSCTKQELELLLRGVPYEESEVIASRVGKHSPPANMRDFRFGKHCFASVRLYGDQSGVNIIS